MKSFFIVFRFDFTSLSEEQKQRCVMKSMDKMLVEVSSSLPRRTLSHIYTNIYIPET